MAGPARVSEATPGASGSARRGRCGGYQTEGRETLHFYDGMMRDLRQALRLLERGDEVGALELLLSDR
jgi:hypothetical protein